MPGPGPSQKLSDLTKLTVAELKLFLKARNLRSTGRKADLLKLAKLYFNSPILRTESCPSASASDIFTKNGLVWNAINLPVVIPSSFSIDTITSYLSTIPVSMVIQQSAEEVEEEQEEEEEANAGTDKPSVKGRRMYISEKLTLVEWATSGTNLLFRSNCEASLRKSCRYPAVAISKEGSVIKGKCNCPALAGIIEIHYPCFSL
jgi:hypothetical protein